MRHYTQEYFSQSEYTLLPFQFERIDDGYYLAINDVGEYCKLSFKELNELINGTLSDNRQIFHELLSKSFIATKNHSFALRAFSSKYKSRKSFMKGGPGLHIFVLTLRCDNSCEYCQVSRKKLNDLKFDMTIEVAKQSVERMFESPSKNITVEFQGGEPLLAFNTLKFIVEYCEELNLSAKKNLQYVVATSLQVITTEILSFMKDYGVHISTSLDGPEWLHNKNRPSSCNNSYKKVIKGIDLSRKWLGDDSIAAMTTITSNSLSSPKEIVDEYIANDFHSIFLRPLNMYGFAVKKKDKISYSSARYNSFYAEALEYIVEKNKGGYYLDEVNCALALNNILTPHPIGYVDMRSPCGDGTGVLVYNYNGKVYPSDESRMLLEMGDDSLCLGSVEDSYNNLLSAPPMERILNYGVAESIPGCAYCAYLPYCGANPVQNLTRQGDMIGHRSNNDFCKKQKFLFQQAFKLIDNEENIDVVGSWLTNHQSQREDVQ